ncbi:hypothetical protein E1H12_20085 [Geitlerinema sp. P-1104]|nr:hypothetical protein [Geitlerinema sp. P-1104]
MNFCKQTLNWVDFSTRNHYLMDIDFSDADLHYSSFKGLFLNNLKFIDSRLPHTNFQNTHLIGVDFTSADVFNANFSGARLINSDLSKVKNLEQNQLSEAQICQTALPSSLTINSDRDCSDHDVQGIIRSFE